MCVSWKDLGEGGVPRHGVVPSLAKGAGRGAEGALGARTVVSP